MFRYFNSLNAKKNKLKHILISLLVLTSLFLAFNHYPPIMSRWEGAIIYEDFLPTHNPTLIFSISEDPSTTGVFSTFGYATLILSRYISDYFGHDLSNVRLPSILFGLIALFLFYVIINRWFEWKIALVSTFLLATNQHFLTFQHLLLPQMVTLTSIMFCIERFQNLLTKNSKFAILSFGFACALTTLHYWTGRFCMLSILFFYLIDFKKFSIIKYKSYLHFTNLERVKTVLLVFLSMVLILTIFYPPNILLLFSFDFIYPSVRIEEYSVKTSQTLDTVWHNLVYYFKYYIFNKSNYPSDIIQFIPYPVESLIILLLCSFGIIISLFKKISYSFLFLLYIFFITLFPLLFSQTDSAAIHEASTSLHGGRVLFAIPFICAIAVVGFRYIYKYSLTKNTAFRSTFIILIGIFFCFRLYGYFNEIERFKTDIHSFEIDFSQPAMNDGISQGDNWSNYSFKMRRDTNYNQIYYYRMANFISNRLKPITLKPGSTNLLYIPSEVYTPFKYRADGGNIPLKGDPYYFPMYLTFYLQEEGINVSYLVKKEDIKETFLKKSIRVIERYNMGQNIDSEGTLSRGHYPRNKKQEQIVKMFGKTIQWIESYKFGAKWLETIRQQPHFNSEILFVGNYFINVTSDKNPEYLIITNKEELDEVKKQTNYELVLSLPLL